MVLLVVNIHKVLLLVSADRNISCNKLAEIMLRFFFADDVQKGGRSLKRTVILLSLVGAATVFIVIPFFLGVIYCIKRHR